MKRKRKTNKSARGVLEDVEESGDDERVVVGNKKSRNGNGNSSNSNKKIHNNNKKSHQKKRVRFE